MATAAAPAAERPGSSLATLSHISECLLCHDVYKDPRLLPCVHSFCLSCLRQYAIDRSPGEQVPCPYCKKPFLLPVGGVGWLPKNLYMGKLADLHAVNNRRVQCGGEGVRCAVCGSRGRRVPSAGPNESAGDAGEANGAGQACGATVRWASKYCLDCRQEMCTKCTVLHHKMKSSKSHTIVELGSKLNAEKLRKGVSYCDRHEDELLKMYCFQCQQLVCLTCYADQHSRHRCMDINTAAAKFCQQITNDAKDVRSKKLECAAALELVTTAKRRELDELDKARKVLNGATEQCMLRVEMDKAALLLQLTEKHDALLKDISRTRHEMERRIDAMDNFESFSAELVDKGSPTDIVSIARELHDRATELHNGRVPAVLVQVPALHLRPPDDSNTVGTVQCCKQYFQQAVATKKSEGPETPAVTVSLQRKGWVSVVIAVFVIPFCVALLCGMLLQ